MSTTSHQTQVDQNVIRDVLRRAIVLEPPSIETAIQNYPDPLTDQERQVLEAITPDELNALVDIEKKIKDAHKSTKSVWAGAIW